MSHEYDSNTFRFEEFYSETLPVIENTLRGYRLQEDDVKEIARISFFKLWLKYWDRKPKAEYLRILRRIAHNSAMDYFRGLKRRREISLSDPLESEMKPGRAKDLLPATTLNPEEELRNRQALEIFRFAADRFHPSNDDELFDVMQMVFSREHDHDGEKDRLAEAMGITKESLSTVRRRARELAAEFGVKTYGIPAECPLLTRRKQQKQSKSKKTPCNLK